MTAHFTDKEMACQCPDCDGGEMNPSFMDRLERLRVHLGFPFIVSSAYRCESHNKAVGGAPNSLHVKGMAVDILVSGDRAYKIIESAKSFGFKGIGISQKSGDTRFIHLDNRSQDYVSLWSY